MNNKYSKAYKEVFEIITHFPEEELNKIPKEKIAFYKENMDENYEFTINPEIDLSEQSISEEANAIIVALFLDYFATEDQKIKINEILKLNQDKEEETKRRLYNPDNLFKNVNHEKALNNSNINQTDLIEYKESFFVKFKHFILKLLHIEK